MPDSLKPLPPRKPRVAWKPQTIRGEVSQDAWEKRRVQTQQWKPKPSP